jgi:hypothetical protein
MSHHRLSQETDVSFLNVTAVFPQVGRNAICPGQFCQSGGGNGVWFYPSSGLSNSGNVVYVDAKSGQLEYLLSN